MEKIELEERTSFTARGTDHGGTTYIVIEYQEVIYRTSDHGVKLPEYRGRLVLRLDDGRAVDFVDSETFKIVETDEIIRKIG